MAYTNILFFVMMFFSAVCVQAQYRTPSSSPKSSSRKLQGASPEGNRRQKIISQKKNDDLWRFGVVGTTSVGTYSGVGATMHTSRSSFSLQWGNVPSYYHEIMAEYFTQSGGNPQAKSVVVDSMQKSHALRADFNYKFGNALGWHLGGALSKVDSRGKTPIDSALAAATEEDLTPLTDLLRTLGLNLEVEIKTQRLLAEVYGGYNWNFPNNFYIGVSLGAMKAINADLQFSAGLGSLEEMSGIKQIIDGMEKDFQDSIMADITWPIVGFSVGYLF